MAKVRKCAGIASRADRVMLMGSAAALCLLAAAPARAQQASAEGELSEVVVTGTSIRGVAPVGSNLISVGRDNIVAQGATTSSELLSSVPQLGNFNAPQELSTSNRFRTSGFLPNIHGLGIYATLTLFNGHRFAATGGEGVFPDPQAIPVIAIERVEVVADGASSIYGSDAVAGVVNFIYRRNFDGFESSLIYGTGAGSYQKRDAAAVWGKTWDGGNLMVAYEYSDNTSPKYREIDFMRQDQRFRGGRDFRATSCRDPNVVAGGVTYGYPGFSTTANRCETNLDADLLPAGGRNAVLITARQELNDSVEVWSEINYSHYRTDKVNAPRSLSIDVPNTNPYFRAPPGSTATTVRVNRAGTGLFPDPHTRQESQLYGVTAGATVKLGVDWVGSAMLHYSKTDDYVYDGEIDAGAAAVLARNTTTATAFNPFGQAADNNAAVLAQIDNGYGSVNDANQYLRELQVKADGPLHAIPGGMIRAAVGASFREEQTQQLQTGGAPSAIIPVRDDNISRTVTAGFGEVHVPLFGPENAVPGFQRLDLALSGRYDHYEKLGGTFNPKVGVVWEPIGDLSLRGSWGTSYVAPNLGKITASFGLPNEGVNISGIGTVNVYNEGGGNPNLNSEEAETYSLGFDYRPSFIPNLRVAATYFDVNYSNLLFQPGTQDLFFNPAFANKLIKNPTPAQLAAAIAYAKPARAVPSHIDYIYETFTINLGERLVNGLDLEANYRFDTDRLGTFTFAANALHLMRFDQRTLETQPYSDRLGTNEAVEWKGRGNVVWNYAAFTVTMSANYTGSYNNITVTPFEKVKSLTTYDLAVAYKLPGPLTGMQLQVRAQNLLDEEPPFYNSANGYDTRTSNPFGRVLEVGLRARF